MPTISTVTLGCLVLALGGCSAGPSLVATPETDRAPARSHASSPFAWDRTGIAPRFARLLHGTVRRAEIAPDFLGAYLAASDAGTGAIDILNKSYRREALITSGLTGPDGDTYDRNGNLYVADYAQIDVQEFAKQTSTPKFTYSSGLTDPVDVTTDSSGNVFVADYHSGHPGSVIEYPQGSNAVFKRCGPGGPVVGVAVDSAGDVFVTYNSGIGGHIAEYRRGLGGCPKTVLGVSLSFAGGLAIDSSGTLVAADQFGGVYFIPPPYTSIGTLLQGFVDPYHVTLDKTQTLLFVADPAAADIVVFTYPAGSYVTTLYGPNGLDDPVGVAANRL